MTGVQCRLQSDHGNGKESAEAIVGVDVHMRVDPCVEEWIVRGPWVQQAQDCVDGVEDHDWIAQYDRVQQRSIIIEKPPNGTLMAS